MITRVLGLVPLVSPPRRQEVGRDTEGDVASPGDTESRVDVVGERVVLPGRRRHRGHSLSIRASRMTSSTGPSDISVPQTPLLTRRNLDLGPRRCRFDTLVPVQGRRETRSQSGTRLTP